jgi:hypothetical protein
LLGLDGDYGGEKTKTQLKIGVDENNGIKAIDNKPSS